MSTTKSMFIFVDTIMVSPPSLFEISVLPTCTSFILNPTIYFPSVRGLNFHDFSSPVQSCCSANIWLHCIWRTPHPFVAIFSPNGSSSLSWTIYSLAVPQVPHIVSLLWAPEHSCPSAENVPSASSLETYLAFKILIKLYYHQCRSPMDFSVTPEPDVAVPSLYSYLVPYVSLS